MRNETMYQCAMLIIAHWYISHCYFSLKLNVIVPHSWEALEEANL